MLSVVHIYLTFFSYKMIELDKIITETPAGGSRYPVRRANT